MSGRREPVPFAFVAEADRFRSNVTPPPPERASVGQMAGRWLLGLTLVAGLVGSLVIGTPALSADSSGSGTRQSQATEGR
ncbi:membrane protein [Streptomyces caelestis]|uniref:Membrane protein n=2 Tax=Streptomyces TaxID=1883 RepID=A0A0M8QNZ5_9ACTN|nr:MULTISPECIES: membrane protein [Streptomyces]KOT34523.1 membrane protein [Streptomyces caelestis]KOV23771.1 membrane protein [Streptomyces sp. XY152]